MFPIYSLYMSIFSLFEPCWLETPKRPAASRVFTSSDQADVPGACFPNYRLWSTCGYCCPLLSLCCLDPVVCLLTRWRMQTTKACLVPGESGFFFKQIVLEEKCTQYFSMLKKDIVLPFSHFIKSQNHFEQSWGNKKCFCSSKSAVIL